MSDLIAWAPQPGPQHALVDCPAPLVFFGGARGGGKTDGVLGKWGVKAELYGSAFNAIAFRRTTVSFEDAVERGKQIYIPLGWRFTLNNNRPQFVHPSGARIGFRYLETVSDAGEYQGRNLSDAWVEEAGQYPTPAPIDRLFGVLRSAAGAPVQLILTANPGGAGQHWLRERFSLHPFPRKPQLLTARVGEGEIVAAVIPSRIGDNRILVESDPGYVDRLRLVGGAELVRAWLEGDWSAIEGAFFDTLSEERHALRPFAVPDDWLRFRSFDWGFAAPFSCGWWAVAGDDAHGVPRGALVRYREWYGATGPQAGLRLDAEQVAEGVKAKEAGETISYGVADPAMWGSDSGPSIAERMARAGVSWRPADNRRVARAGAAGGWDQMRARLRGDGAAPMLYVFDTCRDWWRTVPVLQHDPDRAEDLDTAAEDHAADDTRYACMSRPYVPRPVDAAPKRDVLVGQSDGSMRSTLTVREMIDRKKRRRLHGDADRAF